MGSSVVERIGGTPPARRVRERRPSPRRWKRPLPRASARSADDYGQHIQTGYSAVAVVLSFWTLTISIFFMGVLLVFGFDEGGMSPGIRHRRDAVSGGERIFRQARTVVGDRRNPRGIGPFPMLSRAVGARVRCGQCGDRHRLPLRAGSRYRCTGACLAVRGRAVLRPAPNETRGRSKTGHGPEDAHADARLCAPSQGGGRRIRWPRSRSPRCSRGVPGVSVRRRACALSRDVRARDTPRSASRSGARRCVRTRWRDARLGTVRSVRRRRCR